MCRIKREEKDKKKTKKKTRDGGCEMKKKKRILEKLQNKVVGIWREGFLKAR